MKGDCCVETVFYHKLGGVPMDKSKKQPLEQSILLTIPDVAVHLRVCRQTVYNYIYREQLPSVKVRGMRRVHPDSLRRWVQEREQVFA